MFKRKLVYGVGINDYPMPVQKDGVRFASYLAWKNMLKRCYLKSFQENNLSYVGCKVCDAWLSYSCFKEWYDKNYVATYQLDKDLLLEGNKIYGPTACFYVTSHLNKLFLTNPKIRGDYPQGVSWSKPMSKFRARFVNMGKEVLAGYYDTPEDASEAYTEAKRLHIIEVLEEHQRTSQVAPELLTALLERYNKD